MGCWGEVEAALVELARMEGELAKAAATGSERMARLEGELAAEKAPLEGRREEVAAAVERFCRSQRPALDRVDGHDLRSRRLRFGRVGWRASQAVVIRDQAAAMKALAGWRPGRAFLRVRTEVDREGLREFLAKAQALNGSGAAPTPSGQALRRRLRRAGVRIEQREKWFYEIDWEAIKERKRSHRGSAVSDQISRGGKKNAVHSTEYSVPRVRRATAS